MDKKDNTEISKKKSNRQSCYEVMVHKLCNERCLFCSQDHESRITATKPDDDEIYKRILIGKKQEYGMLGFTGGEPLIHPHILNYFKFAKKAGFNYIRVQTNGVMLGIPGFAKKCVEAGATLFKLSVHHYKDEIHDSLVGYKGALEKVKYGIKELKKLGARTGINIVLTEQNYRDLTEIFLYFLDMGVSPSNFVIIFPLYENSMKDEADKVGFKFSETIPYIIKTLHAFDKLGLKRPLILNLPMCLLPGYENSIIQTFNGTAVLNLDGSKSNIDENKSEGKTRVPICTNCEFNTICYGVDSNYLKFAGDSEFQKKKEKINLKFNLDELSLKHYFSEDELCFLEILNVKDGVTAKEISEIKKDIQICKHCDSMDKLQIVVESLIKKGYISISGEGMQSIYSKKKGL